MNKVLAYAPLVASDGEATVHLTFEDWHVLADTLFRMNTPKEFLPSAIVDFRIRSDGQAIELDTADYRISVEMF